MHLIGLCGALSSNHSGSQLFLHLPLPSDTVLAAHDLEFVLLEEESGREEPLWDLSGTSYGDLENSGPCFQWFLPFEGTYTLLVRCRASQRLLMSVEHLALGSGQGGPTTFRELDLTPHLTATRIELVDEKGASLAGEPAVWYREHGDRMVVMGSGDMIHTLLHGEQGTGFGVVMNGRSAAWGEAQGGSLRLQLALRPTTELQIQHDLPRLAEGVRARVEVRPRQGLTGGEFQVGRDLTPAAVVAPMVVDMDGEGRGTVRWPEDCEFSAVLSLEKGRSERIVSTRLELVEGVWTFRVTDTARLASFLEQR